jgi:hypothetical protein
LDLEEVMPLFKFRSEEKFGYALDIILNRRLYCADWRDMNDIMEGWAVPCVDKVYNGEVAYSKVAEAKGNLRVCSLSTTFKSHLLWAHYASGFKGMAIEVDVPGHLIEDVICLSDISDGFPETTYPELIAKECLRRKHTDWEYECEVRIIQREEYVNNVSVIRVIAGSRMDKALLKTLYKACHLQGIGLCGLGFVNNEILTLSINDAGIFTE